MIKPELSIVIPAYCEEERIGQSLETLASYLSADGYCQSIDVEVIVVAANAPDKTFEIVSGKSSLFKNFQLLRPGAKSGKGRDVQYGVLRAAGEYVLFMDADLATPLHRMEEFLEKCKSGSDIVIGTRNLLSYKESKLHGIFALFGNLIYRIVALSNIEDTQCGFKMFTREAALICFTKLTIKGWGFDLEVLEIAKTNKLKITKVRIVDWTDQPYSTHTDGKCKIIERSVKDLVTVKMNRLKRRY